MIRQDRLELNERFLKVFQLLQERGDVVMNDRNGKGMGDFAEKILGNRAYGHIVRAFLNKGDRRVIDYHQARAVCREYNVNEAYLVDGIGTPFGFDLPKSLSGPGAPKGNILFTTIAAFAGSGVEATGGQAVEDNLYYAIPGISGSGLVAFPIEGNSMDPLKFHEFDDTVKIMYCFQSWCPGCHSSGFPTLEELQNHFYPQIKQGKLKAWVVQTVFEGAEVNTFDKLLETQRKYDLPLPFGHDEASPYPSVMKDYRTGGTPWYVIIDKNNKVIYNDYHIGVEQAKLLIDHALVFEKSDVSS